MLPSERQHRFVYCMAIAATQRVCLAVGVNTVRVLHNGIHSQGVTVGLQRRQAIQ